MSQAPDGRRPGELVYWWKPRGDDRVFDLATWDEGPLESVRALLGDEGIEHRWEGTDLVVAAGVRDDVAGVLDAVIEAAHPRLDGDAERTAYELADWPDYELETLQQALDDEGIVHEWTEEGELLVYEADEERVDELFERLDLRGPDPGIELDGELLQELLTTLLTASDRLVRDVGNADARLTAYNSALEVEQLAVPYGMDPDTWHAFVAQTNALRTLIGRQAEAAGRTVQPADDELAEEPVDESVEGDGEPVEGDDEPVAEGVDEGDDEGEDEDEAADAPGESAGTGLGGPATDEQVLEVATRVRDRLRRML